MKTNKGLTLMELTIVLAVLAIIGLILSPMFTQTTDRARLRSDIQSAQVIQNAMDLYRVERGRSVVGANMEEVLTRLNIAGMLSAQVEDIQTEDAEWIMNADRTEVRVDISSSPDNIHRAYSGLTDDEQEFVLGWRNP